MSSPRVNLNLISFKLAKKLVFGLFFVLIFDFFLFPAPILASEYEEAADNTKIIVEQENFDYIAPKNNLPESDDLEVAWDGYYSLTAYTSEVGQTDGNPCGTANGFDLCEHGIEDSVAANFLKFGTKIRIPELFGDQVFVVRDRMNKRYQNRVDIWFKDKEKAKKFGVKISLIEVLQEH